MRSYIIVFGSLLLQTVPLILTETTHSWSGVDLRILFQTDRIWVFSQPYDNYVLMGYMLDLFSSRFKIMLTECDPGSINVFDVVAHYNHRKKLENPNFQPLRVLAQFVNLNSNLFQSCLKDAEKANKLFNESVAGFIFSDSLALRYITMESLNLIAEANHTYQTVLSVHESFCTGTAQPHLLGIFTNLDLVLMELPFKESYHLKGADSVVMQMDKEMIECQDNLKTAGVNASIGFFVEWPDTDVIATVRNQTELVRFWTGIAEISNRKNITISFSRAFDRSKPSPRHIDNLSGWWTTDWKEKAMAPNDSSIILSPNAKNFFSCRSQPNVTKLKHVKSTTSSFQFDRNMFGVIFRTDFLQSKLSREEIVPFVGALSERFSKIIHILPKDSKELRSTVSTEYQVLHAVAQWNKFRATCSTPPGQELELSMTIDLQVELDDIIAYENSVTNLAIAASLLNNVYGGTVRNIVLVIPDRGPGWNIIGDQLKNLRRIAHAHGLNFSVIEQGIRIENPQEFYQWKRYVYANVDFVYIRFGICDDSQLKVALRDHNSFHHVLMSIKKRFQELTNGLEESPEQTDKTGVFIDMAAECDHVPVNQSEVSKFWISLNKYAKEYTTSVVVSPAFSIAGKSSLGWWHVSSNGPYYTMTESHSEQIQGHVANANKIDYVSVILWSSIPWLIIIILWICIRKCIRYRKVKNKQTDMCLQEIKHFRGENPTQEFIGGVGLISASVALAYDTSLEVDPKDFKIENETLGSGSLGCVIKGTILKASRQISVAAKTLHCNHFKDVSALRSLLMEIKVSSYLGKHNNITQLVGAFTREANLGKVYAFFELCSLGSLQNFLRKQFREGNVVHDGSKGNLVKPDIPVNNLYLKWSLEIAEGMEYIGSKFIVHGDLATRNVLLDAHMVAKICDFGLSRRMENYQNYVKSNSEPLPWRWMAYESLTILDFSMKSDVWSYGVTLWEIFSDGGVPYPGLSWTPEFVRELKQGMRLPEPINSTSNIYALMTSCWMISTDERPTFTTIKQKLSDTIRDLQFQALSSIVERNC